MTTPHDPHNHDDDALGAALGESLRGRVDTIPTITPGFDGVERRARQITNRRRALAGAAVGAFLLLGGIGIAALTTDDATDQDTLDSVPDTSVPDPAPDPVDDPAIDGPTVVTGLIEKARFVRVDGETETELYVAAAGEVLSEALLLADGSFLVEIHDDPLAGAGRVLHLTEPGATPSELSAFGDLAGGAVVDGVPYAWVGDVPDFRNGLPGEDQMTTPLRRIDLRDLSSIDFLDFAYTIESSVESVDVHETQVLVSVSSEAGPEWRILDIDGSSTGTSVSPVATAGLDNAWGGRFDEEGDGMWFLGLDTTSGSFELVGLDFDGSDRRSVAIDPSDGPGQPVLGLQAEDGLVAVNVQVADDELRYVETIWVGADGSTSNEVEPGEVIFVQDAQTTADDPGPTVPPSEPSDPVEPAEWQPLADLGLAEPQPVLHPLAAPIATDSALIGVVDGDAVHYAPDGAATMLARDPDLGSALLGADGSLLLELRNQPGVSPLREVATIVVQVRDDEYRLLSADGRLNGVAEVDGRPVVFVGDYPIFDNTPGGDVADLRMVDLDTGESTVIGDDVFGIEWLVYEAFVGGDPGDPVILLDGSGYQPFWAYRDVEGNVVDLASPTDGRYGSDWANEVDGVGPNADRAALSADASTIYWVEVEPGDPALLTPTAVIHSMDTATGEEGPTIDVSLGYTEVAIHTDLTISGDELLLTRSFDGVDENGDYVPDFRAPIVIDLATATSTELPLPGAAWHFAG